MNLLLLSRPAPRTPPKPPRPTPQPRAPLPPFDPATMEGEPPALHPVYTDLWATPPPAPDVRWWRGDAWSVTVPGLPTIYNAQGQPTSSAGERVLTWFIDQYGRDFEDKILDAHLVRGYTHFSICPQESMLGPSQMSLDDYVAMSVRIRKAGFFVHHLLRSKVYEPHGGNPDDMNPIIDALLAAGAMQVLTPAWESNYLSPDQVQALIDHDSARVGMRCSIMLHFYPHYISWPGPPPDDSAKWWHRQYGKVDGLLYQADPSWTAGMMAARVNDALARLCPGGMYGLGDSGRGHPIDVVAWELVATKQFYGWPDGNGRPGDEDHGNLKGYETLCSPGPMSVYGFGNGARYPDGRVI